MRQGRRWSWEKDVHPDWVDSIKDDQPALYELIDLVRTQKRDDLAAFLCWLGVRVIEMRRVLKPTGSLYLHCDPTASHYIKALLDSVFGAANFQNEIIWHRAAENLSRRKWRRAYENILQYSKGKDWTFNRLHAPITDAQLAQYRHEDESGRYMLTSRQNNADCPNMVYEFHGITRQWRFLRETMERYEREGLLDFNDNGIPRRKNYLSDAKGVALTNVFSDISALTNENEKVGYPTQKPIALYKRIIKASSNEGDIVLDPFCGCATTLVAAEALKRQWIGIDLWEGAATTLQRRLWFPVHARRTPPLANRRRSRCGR